MTALTVGVTTARDEACKRGLATNIAASLARHNGVPDRVCVVDADPDALDVTTRLAVRWPTVEAFARPDRPNLGRLARVESPGMAVLPSGGGPVARLHLGIETVMPELRETFDVVVCDLPGGPSGPGQALGARLDLLDWLVLAVTPESSAVLAARHFLEHFATAQMRGRLAPVRLAVVCTGDEGSAALTDAEVEELLDFRISGRVPQLWGRGEPNRGFGAALAIPELDDAVGDLFETFCANLGRSYRVATA